MPPGGRRSPEHAYGSMAVLAFTPLDISTNFRDH